MCEEVSESTQKRDAYLIGSSSSRRQRLEIENRPFHLVAGYLTGDLIGSETD